MARQDASDDESASPKLKALKGKGVKVHYINSSIAKQLPSPKYLEKYEEIYPGSAERIIRAWEAENENRRTFWNDYLRRETRAMRWWRLASFATLAIGQAISIVLLFEGHFLLGFCLAALFTFGHLAGAYIQGMLLPDAEEQALRERK